MPNFVGMSLSVLENGLTFFTVHTIATAAILDF